MGYITVDDFIDFSWATSLDSETSTRVTMLIDSTTEIINSMVWDLSHWVKSEDIRFCDIENNCCNLYDTIQLENINVESIVEINWLSYAWTINTDYQVISPKKSRIVIKDLSTYTSWLTWNYFNIKYVSWYSIIPNDIKLLQYNMVASQLAEENWQEVKSYTLI